MLINEYNYLFGRKRVKPTTWNIISGKLIIQRHYSGRFDLDETIEIPISEIKDITIKEVKSFINCENGSFFWIRFLQIDDNKKILKNFFVLNILFCENTFPDRISICVSEEFHKELLLLKESILDNKESAKSCEETKELTKNDFGEFVNYRTNYNYNLSYEFSKEFLVLSWYGKEVKIPYNSITNMKVNNKHEYFKEYHGEYLESNNKILRFLHIKNEYLVTEKSYPKETIILKFKTFNKEFEFCSGFDDTNNKKLIEFYTKLRKKIDNI